MGLVVSVNICNLILPYIFPLLSSSTRPGHNSLPQGINQTFIPKGYRPLAVLLHFFTDFYYRAWKYYDVCQEILQIVDTLLLILLVQ